MKTSLSEIPAESKTLDLNIFYTSPVVCYLSTRASMANYLENISYDKFVWYSRPFEFKYQGKNGEIRTGIGGGEQTIEAFHNLGYTVYHGNTAGMFGIASMMRYETPDDNYIFFKTQKEAFEFVKKLISADVPISIQIMGDVHPDFHLITGYNETHVFIPPYKDLKTGKYIAPIFENPISFTEEPATSKELQVLTKEQFFNIWGSTYNFFTWFEKTHEKKTDEEMFEINKQDAIKAAENSIKFAKNPIMGSYTSDGDGAIYTMAASRYLKKHGYTELAEKYVEIAMAYKNKKSYSEIAKLYEEAAKLW